MTLRIVSPAALADIIDLFSASALMKPIDFKALMLQYARCETEVYVLGNDAEGLPISVLQAGVETRCPCDVVTAKHSAIAAAMYYPLPPERGLTIDGRARPDGERLLELAFVCRPELRQHLLAFIRLSHLTRARLAQSGPVRVRAHVRPGHRPGHRLAALVGMRWVGMAAGFDRFEFEGTPDVAVRAGDQVAVHRA